MKKIFKHKEYKKYSDRYKVGSDGTVFNTKTGKFIGLHKNPTSGQIFVRLSAGKGVALSIGINKLMLLTFKGSRYKSGMIAVCADGNTNNTSFKNLRWGSRKLQSKIAMRNPVNRKRVRNMGRKFGELNWKRNLVTDGRALKRWRKDNDIPFSQKKIKKIKRMLKKDISPTVIARKLKIGRSSVYTYK